MLRPLQRQDEQRTKKHANCAPSTGRNQLHVADNVRSMIPVLNHARHFPADDDASFMRVKLMIPDKMLRRFPRMVGRS